MDAWVIRALRAVIAIALLGSVAIQIALILGVTLDERRTIFGAMAAAIVILGIGTLQVTGLCIARLLTMVRKGTVFSHAAFRYVDIVISSIAVGAVLVLALAAVARFANHATPDDEVAPGVVGLVCGLSLVVAGVALVIYVLRMLLAQAVALDSRAKDLQSQLDEVI